MNGETSIQIRVAPSFNELLQQIIMARNKKGNGNPWDVNTHARITLAFARHPLTKTISKEIIDATLEKDGGKDE